MSCKYCMDPNYDWCCPSCFRDFEAERPESDVQEDDDFDLEQETEENMYDV